MQTHIIFICKTRQQQKKLIMKRGSKNSYCQKTKYNIQTDGEVEQFVYTNTRKYRIYLENSCKNSNRMRRQIFFLLNERKQADQKERLVHFLDLFVIIFTSRFHYLYHQNPSNKTKQKRTPDFFAKIYTNLQKYHEFFCLISNYTQFIGVSNLNWIKELKQILLFQLERSDRENKSNITFATV